MGLISPRSVVRSHPVPPFFMLEYKYEEVYKTRSISGIRVFGAGVFGFSAEKN